MSTRIKLDPPTEELLQRLVRSSGRTESEVIREALHRLTDGAADLAESKSLYDALEDIVGLAADGPEDLAERHNERFREELDRRR